jgi:TolB-like protein/tetratricopeptide (TPR) repeat protein
VSLGQRGLALLSALGRADGVAVSKDALLEAAWPGLTVEEGNLTVQMAALRKVLGRRDDGLDWIVTVPRLGYRLLPPTPTPIATQQVPTLAVLPFENRSGDPEQDYFADGMVDELITALSRFRSLAVIARSTSFAYRGRTGDVRAVAAELRARYLVEGSVRRSGDGLRLAAALIEGGSGATLWARSFDGRLDEVFAFQDHITVAVASVVAPRVLSAEWGRAERLRGGSLAAYDLRLQAIAALYRYTPADNEAAIARVEAALKLEPESGVLKGLLCWALEMRFSWNWPPHAVDDRERCLALAHEAIRQVEDDAFILVTCALAMQLLGGEYESGLLVAMRAVELNPNDVSVLAKAGSVHVIGEADRLFRRAIALQPYDAYDAMGCLALACCSRGEFEEAAMWAGRSVAIKPSFVAAYWAIVAACVNLGRLEEAKLALATLLAIAPGLTISQMAGVRLKDPRRREAILDAMRVAGLPE